MILLSPDKPFFYSSDTRLLYPGLRPEFRGFHTLAKSH